MNLYIKYIYIFLLFSSHLYSQKKDTVIWLPPDTSNEHILNIIKDNFLLDNFLEIKNTSHKLKSKKLNDTLYIYINTKHQPPIKIKENFKNWPSRLKKLNDSLINESYIYHQIIPESIKIEQGNLSIFYRLQNMKVKVIDSLIFESQEKFPPNILKNISNKFKNKKITSDNIAQINRFITEKTYFKIVEKPKILITKKQQYLWYRLDKKKSNSLSGFLGFYFENASQKPVFEGEIKSLFTNIFNRGEQITFIWQKKSSYQNLNFDLNIPFIKGYDLNISNHFHSLRNDTISSMLNNKTIIEWFYHKHFIQVNYSYEYIQQELNTSTSNYIGAGYLFQFNNYHNYYQRTAKIEYYYKNSFKKNIIYTRLKNYFKIKTFYWEQNFQHLSNNTNHIIDIQNISQDFFRKKIEEKNDFSDITSLKNNFIFDQKKLKIYLIGDYLSLKTLDNKRFSYANIGVGIKILKENQHLTFEILSSTNNSYDIDNQTVYINIRQEIRF